MYSRSWTATNLNAFSLFVIIYDVLFDNSAVYLILYDFERFICMHYQNKRWKHLVLTADSELESLTYALEDSFLIKLQFFLLKL